MPPSLPKIVQPAEAGIVRAILVREGEEVREGKVLIRMDTRLLEAEVKTLQGELAKEGFAGRLIALDRQRSSIDACLLLQHTLLLPEQPRQSACLALAGGMDCSVIHQNTRRVDGIVATSP